MFIAVHPDDETLGCGGTILKHKAQGDEIFWLILTGPQKGVMAHFTDEFLSKRDAMVDGIAEAYGFSETIKLNLPSQLLHTLDLREIIQKVSEVFKRVEPDIIYMMFCHDVHSDHRVAFDAVYSCTKSFRYPFIKKLYMIEALSETDFAVSIPGNAFIPNVFVDISEYIEKKLEIAAMYKGEMQDDPYPRSYSAIKALARVRGARAGVMYAEAFMLLFEKK